MENTSIRKRIRASFPQIYRYGKNGTTYWEVSARSKKWGLNQRRNFNSESEAVDWAKEIAEQIEKGGSVTDVPKEKLVLAERYEKLG